jgi:hypothetical protein
MQAAGTRRFRISLQAEAGEQITNDQGDLQNLGKSDALGRVEIKNGKVRAINLSCRGQKGVYFDARDRS